MSNLMMLSGGIVEAEGTVSAYVVLSAGHASRLFKVKGTGDAMVVTELQAATTIDLRRFEREVTADLEPTLEALKARGLSATIATPAKDWVCGLVREHLKTNQGLDVP